MTINWGYVVQQLLMVAMSGAIALALLAVLRHWPSRRERRGARLLGELPALAIVLGVLGTNCERIGLARVLPGAVLPWTVGVALAFYWMAVWWPLRVLWLRRALWPTPTGKLVLVTATASVLVASWSLFVEPQRLEVEPRELTFTELGGHQLRLAHISDLQMIAFGPRDRALIEAVNAFEPDLIVITGDYIAATLDESCAVAAARTVLGGLHARHGIFATTSDSDTEEQRLRIFDGLPVHYLQNRSTTVEIDGVKVRIGGIDHLLPRIERTGAGATPDELFVVGCHSPDFAERTAELLPNADLYLCGHTHGGQLQIPGFGPVLVFCSVPRRIGAGGLFHTAGGMPYLVTRGIGMEGGYAPRFRLNCRPHVFLLTLRGDGPDRPTLRQRETPP